jgi:hypothetical protein
VIDAALAAVQTTLNAGVQANKWSQDDATKIYDNLHTNIDGFLTKFLYRYSPDAVNKDKPAAPDASSTK